MQVDPYNRFCIDCLHSHSTHVLLALGIFLCANCAQAHRSPLAGYSYTSLTVGLPRVKEVLREHWDDYQLLVIAPEVGGNRRFFDFLEEYRLHSIKEAPIEKRYKSDAVRHYARRLAAIADSRGFNEKPPAKDWDEKITRAKTVWKDWVTISEKKIG